MQKHESAVISYSPSEAIEAREKIFEMLLNYPATKDEHERSLGLFLRGSLLARILATSDIYKKIVDLPGSILDIGTWRGQTAVLCENFRAIFEPLHFNRRIFCFDTFEGYKGFSSVDKATALHADGTYDLGGDSYAQLLEELLVLHERSNAMGHNSGKHRVIQGDCRVTLPNFFEENPNEFIALAFFDVNSYQPTLEAFNLVWERMVPGGITVFWQLTRNVVPAEGMVYTSKILNQIDHRILKSDIYPGLCYLIK